MSDHPNHNAPLSNDAESTGDGKRKGRREWSDPSVPVGNTPATSRGLVFAWALLWVAWVVFLLVVLFSGNTHGTT